MRKLSLLLSIITLSICAQQLYAEPIKDNKEYDLTRYVEFTTSFEAGQQIKLAFEDGMEAWIDMNANQTVDEGEVVVQHGSSVNDFNFFTLAENKTIRVYGKYKEFFCIESGLTSVDLSHVSDLGSVCVSKNSLTELDLKQNLELTYVECQKNEIKELNLTGFNKIQVLAFQQNKIKLVDVSNKPDLYYITSAMNEIDEENMETIVQALPTRSMDNQGYWFILALNNDAEQNFMSESQYAAANAKNWNIKAWDSDMDAWVNFPGFSSIEDLDAAYALRSYYHEGMLLIDNLSMGEQIEVYNVSGKLVYSQLASSIDEQIDIRLPLGVYIVKNANQSSKFLVR